MLKVRTILHATDMTPHSRLAFEVACSLARDAGARLVLLHVVPSLIPAVVGGPAPEPSPEMLAELRGYQQEMRGKFAELGALDLAVEQSHLLREGYPIAEILKVADEVHCELIVLGTHGWVGVMRESMGSVAEAVTRQASCAVVTVRPAE